MAPCTVKSRSDHEHGSAPGLCAGRPHTWSQRNEHGYYVGQVERNLYWVTDGTYQCAFLTTPDGVVLLDAPPTIGHNIQRAIDEIA